MAYNRTNKLMLIQDIQRIYKQHKKDGVSVVHVYRAYIQPVYRISYSTFYNYLCTPATRLLKEREAKQPALF